MRQGAQHVCFISKAWLQVMLMEVCDKLREQEHLGVEYPQDACKPEFVEGFDQ